MLLLWASISGPPFLAYWLRAKAVRTREFQRAIRAVCSQDYAIAAGMIACESSVLTGGSWAVGLRGKIRRAQRAQVEARAIRGGPKLIVRSPQFEAKKRRSHPLKSHPITPRVGTRVSETGTETGDRRKVFLHFGSLMKGEETSRLSPDFRFPPDFGPNGEPNEWVKVPGTDSDKYRPKWEPKFKPPGQSPPRAFWDPHDGYWSLDRGKPNHPANISTGGAPG